MKTPKNCIAIEFGKLLPGDEFVQPENLNRVLVKRRSGSRFCYAEPGGVLGDDKIIFAKKGERQERISGVVTTLQNIENQVKTCKEVVESLRGTEDEPERTTPEAA